MNPSKRRGIYTASSTCDVQNNPLDCDSINPAKRPKLNQSSTCDALSNALNTDPPKTTSQNPSVPKELPSLESADPNGHQTSPRIIPFQYDPTFESTDTFLLRPPLWGIGEESDSDDGIDILRTPIFLEQGFFNSLLTEPGKFGRDLDEVCPRPTRTTDNGEATAKTGTDKPSADVAVVGGVKEQLLLKHVLRGLNF